MADRVLRLKDVHIVFICPRHNAKYRGRYDHMENLIRHRIGAKSFEWVHSSSEDLPCSLSRTFAQVLRKYASSPEPLLLLEDDVEWDGQEEVTIPAGADALYLGLSRCGSSPHSPTNDTDALFIPHSDTAVRVVNMLSIHAVLYLNAEYMLAAAAAIERIAHTRMVCDVPIAHLQGAFNVYACRRPPFYQSAAVDGEYATDTQRMVEFLTRFTI